jgi:hypothetical protein
MAQLSETLRLQMGKSNYELLHFFHGLMEKGEARVYRIQMDAQTILKDDENERVVRTLKGASYGEVPKMQERDPHMIEYAPTKRAYTLIMNSRGGDFYDEGNFQTTYYDCTVQRLKEDCDRSKIKVNDPMYGDRRIDAKGMIDAAMSIHFESDSDDRNPSANVTRGRLVLEGMSDELFEKVIAFVKE